MTDPGPLFVHPSGPDHFWILIGIFAVPTIALCIYALLRGQLPAVLGGSALVLLPIFGYVLGNLHLVDESKTVEFCGSCHVTMPPLVESMQTGNDNLAAAHYRRGAFSQKEASERELRVELQALVAVARGATKGSSAPAEGERMRIEIEALSEALAERDERLADLENQVRRYRGCLEFPGRTSILRAPIVRASSGLMS